MTTRKKKTTSKADQRDFPELAIEKRPPPTLPTAPGIDFAALAQTDIDPDKLERLIAMQERLMAKQAEAQFNVAFVEMQAALPEIDQRGKRIVKGKLHNTYAKHEDIQRVLKPILQAHGFALSFDPKIDESGIAVTAILIHRAGHSRQATFGPVPPDAGGSKNTIQEYSSSVSYGERIATIAVCNITTRGMDDDGGGGRNEAPAPPDDYEGWLLSLEAVAAEQGTAALQKFWKDSDKTYQAYLTKWNLGGWDKVKKTAIETTAAQGAA